MIVNSVLWAVALNTHSGCLAVSQTLRMAGQTFGLRGFRYVTRILMPAAFPAILAGLKIGWAFAWRTLIAAELVFGVSSGRGGLGWYIFENRNLLNTANVFAGLLTVMAVGLIVEGLIFGHRKQRPCIAGACSSLDEKRTGGEDKLMDIGWIGIGRMGYAMAERLLKAGRPLKVSESHPRQGRAPRQARRHRVDRSSELRGVDVLFTMVSTGKDLREVYFGKDGVIGESKSNLPGILVDCSSIGVDKSEENPRRACRARHQLPRRRR